MIRNSPFVSPKGGVGGKTVKNLVKIYNNMAGINIIIIKQWHLLSLFSLSSNLFVFCVIYLDFLWLAFPNWCHHIRTLFAVNCSDQCLHAAENITTFVCEGDMKSGSKLVSNFLFFFNENENIKNRNHVFFHCFTLWIRNFYQLQRVKHFRLIQQLVQSKIWAVL